MLLTRWWESHWDRRQRTSRTTLTRGFLSASNQARSSAPLQCFMESHGSDPAPHALSLFMLIRSVVLCLSTEHSRDSFLFLSFPFFVAARIVQLSTLSSHRTGPSSITSDFILGLSYQPSPIVAWAPEQGTETSAQLSPYPIITIQLWWSNSLQIILIQRTRILSSITLWLFF